MRREALAAWIRDTGLRAARRGLALAWETGRRRPEAVFAAAVFVGVAVMILHWS